MTLQPFNFVTYRFNQNKPSGVQHTYVMNEFLTGDPSCTPKYFWKNSYRSLYFTSLQFFWDLLHPNWWFLWWTVSLWRMFGNRQIPAIEGKCWFRNSSESVCRYGQICTFLQWRAHCWGQKVNDGKQAYITVIIKA